MALLLEELTDPLTEFFSAIKSPLTRRNYVKDLKYFFDSIGLDGDFKEQAREFTAKSKQSPSWAVAIITSYVLKEKERVEAGEISESRIANLYKPIRLFCEENDVVLNWKKLGRRVPKGKRAADDRKPELEEIRKILTYPDRRIRPVVLTMESSGCRIGSFDYLNWGHIEPIEKNGILLAAKIKIYAGTDEEYSSFITPECYRSLKEYVDYRASQGEKITRDSPLIRDLFHPDHLGQGEPHIPIRLKSTGVKRLVEDALKATGIRGKLKEGKKRHEFQTDHGFRKFFKSQCEMHMKSIVVELLMGHSLGVADSYFRPDNNELLNEYLKGVPDLLVSEQPPIEVVERDDVKELKAKVERMEAQFDERVEARVNDIQNSPETIRMLQDALAAANKERDQLRDNLDKKVEEEIQRRYGDMNSIIERRLKELGLVK